MNAEYLSDGFLYESVDAWKNAFETDGGSARREIDRLYRSPEKDLARFYAPERFAEVSSLLTDCRTAVDRLFDDHPDQKEVFPNPDERSAFVLPVCRFLSCLEEMRASEWSVLSSLTALEEEGGDLLKIFEQLLSVFTPAALAAKGSDFSDTTEQVLAATITRKEQLLQALKEERDFKALFLELHQGFFSKLPQELSSAADLEESGKNASPAAIFRIVGEAKAFLVFLLREIPARFLPESPF